MLGTVGSGRREGDGRGGREAMTRGLDENGARTEAVWLLGTVLQLTTVSLDAGVYARDHDRMTSEWHLTPTLSLVAFLAACPVMIGVLVKSAAARILPRHSSQAHA
jgi:hypothetical protein